MATPTYNKWKSTTVYGNFSVRDLTNSAGTSVVEVALVDLSGNFLSRGESTFSKAVTCNGTISNNKHLSTKEYVDSAISGLSLVYQTISGMSSYLTSATASSTYATIASLGSYLTSATAASTYQTISGMSSYLTTTAAGTTYQTISGMSSYLTTSSASSTYATIASLGSYLTSATAGTTYQTISGMTNYLTTASASSTYATIASLGDYLSTADAAGTYSTLTNEVKTNTINEFTAQNIFFENINPYKAIDQDQTLPSGVINKFLYTNFLEAVQFGGGFSQSGTDANSLDNLTLSLGDFTMERGRVNLPTNVLTPATSANQLGHRINGTLIGSIGSATNVNLSTITLPFGIYIVVGNVVFTSNATVGTISKYQIGFNNTGGTNFTSAVVGYGGNSTIATTASTANQLALTTTEVVSITSSTLNFRLIANITYATTTMSINTTLSKFTAVRIA